jgi:glycosyl transferase family 25
MLNEFKKHNIDTDNVEFIETYDREVLTKEDLNRFVKITNSEISLFLKHIEIYRKIVDDTGITLVFEDDAVFVDNFKYLLNDYLINLPENFDVIFACESSNLHIFGNVINKYYYSYNCSRGTGFYIINNKCIRKILDKFEQDSVNKISYAIDWYFNKIIPELNLSVYWTEPTIVYQGSETGLFKSSLR